MGWAALITWIITAAFGAFMVTTWVRHGGARGTNTAASHFPPPLVFGHLLLAVAGLVVWIVYLVGDLEALAWVAFGVLVVVALGGDVLVYRWARDRRTPTGARGQAATAAGGSASATATRQQLAEQRIPTVAVAGHGVFAVATIVLVLLTALGVGGS